MEQRLQEVFRAVLNLESVSDWGEVVPERVESWDSLAHVLLVSAVETEFEVAIDLAEAMEARSFNAFRRLVQVKNAGNLKDAS